MSSIEKIAANLPKIMAHPEGVATAVTAAGTLIAAAAPVLPFVAIGAGGYALVKWLVED